jgi:glycosyltransferase involved in cell wall biosynthesis
MNGHHAPRPHRIAVVTETYPPEVNGVARTIGVMVEGLRERGHSIQLIRPRQGKRDTPESRDGLETLLKPGVPLPRYQELRMGLPAKRSLLRAWRARRPDIVQIVTEGPLGASGLAAAKTLGIPIVSEFHTNFHSYSKHYGLGLFTDLVAGHLRRLHNRADCTLVPTAEMKQQLAAAGYQRLAVVGRGIDLEQFNAARRNSALRATWDAAEQDLVALYVGRLAPEKNLRLFVEAAQAMQAVTPRLRVIVVGDGPEGNALRASRREFVFAGMRNGAALAEHYASADVFLFPSLTETFGNVTTEAMASRLAIVAYDYAAARQYIRHRVNGLLAPFGVPAGFIDAAQDVAADPRLRERIRDAALQTATQLTWPRVLDELERVFAEVIGRARSRRVVVGGAGPPGPRTDHAPL